MAPPRAQVENRIAMLWTEFGLSLAMRKFNLTVEQIETMVGCYARGRHKGELRGCIRWKKCVRGGWYATGPGYMNGYVMKPGSWDYEIADPFNESRLYWNATFAEFGWLPGESREEYAKRKGYNLANVGAGPAPRAKKA